MDQPVDLPGHPILVATADIAAALKEVASVNPTFMTTDDKARALREVARLEGRLTELKLRLLADAGDVAATTAARDPGDWLADATRARIEDARAEHAVAVALDRRYTAVGDALRDGEATFTQATVVVRALDALPADVGADIVARAETTLIGPCADFGPRTLARLGSRILAVVAPEIAHDAEARRLAALEQEAHRRTRLSLRRCGDGSTRLSGLVPDHVASRLATYLEAFTNPRKASQATASQAEATPDPPGDPLARLPYPRRLGDAFCQLLESIDPRRLPLHAGDATTVVVTIDLAALRGDLGTGEILSTGHVPGDAPSASPQPRSAASPATPRSFQRSSAPTRSPSTSDAPPDSSPATSASPSCCATRTCRAEGCTIPGTWTEAHHWLPWSAGGTTDLAHGILLCRHHHRPPPRRRRPLPTTALTNLSSVHPPRTSEEVAAVLRGFARPDGTLHTIPSKRAKLLVVLDHLAQSFELGRTYPEAEVNEVLGRFHPDHAALRRYLVEDAFLTREDGRYWRTGGTVDVDDV